MAAEYTQFSLDDIEKFLKRAFRILRPKKGEKREIYYDLSLSKYVVIRVWTSVYRGEELVRGKERRPVRVQFLSAVNGYPLVSGKAPIVKRTQNWRKTLQDRIEDYVEKYEESGEEYWDNRAQGSRDDPKPTRRDEPSRPPERPNQPPPRTPDAPRAPRSSGGGPPATDPQKRYLKFLWGSVKRAKGSISGLSWDDIVNMDRLPGGVRRILPDLPFPDADGLNELSKRQASIVIDGLKSSGYGESRYANEEEGQGWREDAEVSSEDRAFEAGWSGVDSPS